MRGEGREERKEWKRVSFPSRANALLSFRRGITLYPVYFGYPHELASDSEYKMHMHPRRNAVFHFFDQRRTSNDQRLSFVIRRCSFVFRAFYCARLACQVSDRIDADLSALCLASVDTIQDIDHLQGLFRGHRRGSAIHDCLGKFDTFLGMRFKPLRKER